MKVTEGLLRTAHLTVQHLHSVPDGPSAGRVLLLGGSNFDLTLKRAFLGTVLAEVYELATYEPRGIGRTDRPAPPWTMEDYAEDAHAVLDALGWDDVIVVGESFGGMTALHLAALAPERVRVMVLASAAAGGAGGGSYDISEFLALPRAQAARAALRLQDTRNATLEQNDPAGFTAKRDARLAFEEAFHAGSGQSDGYPALLDARRTHDVWDALPRLDIPTLILAGLYDRQAPLAAQRAMAGRLPRATLWERDGGHGLLFDGRAMTDTIHADWLTRYGDRHD